MKNCTITNSYSYTFENETLSNFKSGEHSHIFLEVNVSYTVELRRYLINCRLTFESFTYYYRFPCR